MVDRKSSESSQDKKLADWRQGDFALDAGDAAFADLRRIMSVDKEVVRSWSRKKGFSSEEGQICFAAALERKFGQFAFPDEFDQAIKSFRERIWSRHAKGHSMPGEVYRSLAQIRFRSDPDWSSKKQSITVIAIMSEKPCSEAWRNEISKELEQTLSRIQWPKGYAWGAPRFILATADDLTAKDVMTSQRGDFDFLCY